MFTPIDRDRVSLYHDIIWENSKKFLRADSSSPLSHIHSTDSHQQIAKLQEIYGQSFDKLVNAIGRVNSDVPPPTWRWEHDYIHGKNLDISCLSVLFFTEDNTYRFSVQIYPSYLQLIEKIKKLYDYDQKLEAYLANDWDSQLKQRLVSFQKISAFN